MIGVEQWPRSRAQRVKSNLERQFGDARRQLAAGRDEQLGVTRDRQRLQGLLNLGALSTFKLPPPPDNNDCMTEMVPAARMNTPPSTLSSTPSCFASVEHANVTTPLSTSCDECNLFRRNDHYLHLCGMSCSL